MSHRKNINGESLSSHFRSTKDPFLLLRNVCSVWLKTLLLTGALFSFSSGEAKDLVVGMELSYPPFEMTNEKNEPTGVSVDMARALAEKLKRPLVIENIPFDGLISALRTGKVDLVISSMTATPERAEAIDFSDPYVETGLALLVSQKTKCNSWKECNRKGIRVAVKKGTTGHLFAAKNMKNAEILIFDKEATALLELTQGKADVFIYDQLSVLRHNKRHSTLTRAILEPFQKESWAVALKKGETGLKKEVNLFLKDFQAKGGFEALAQKHLAEEKKAFEEQGIPFLFLKAKGTQK